MMGRISCFLVAFSSVFLSSCNQRKKQIAYYPDGVVSYLFYTQDGKQDGLSTAYYPSGRLKSRSSWKEGQQNGPAIFRYPNGALKSSSFWKSNLQYGLSKTFFESGILKEVAMRDTSNHLQSLREYYQNGKRKRIVNFSVYTNHKTVILFDTTGRPTEKQVKDAKETLLYVGSFEKERQESLGFIVPFYKNETDTIYFTDVYRADIYFGLRINRMTRLVIDSSILFKAPDTLSSVLGMQGVTFHIIRKPLKLGQNKFYYKFTCLGCQADTLMAAGIVGSHFFIVKK